MSRTGKTGATPLRGGRPTVTEMNELLLGSLPGILGFEVTSLENEGVGMRVLVRPEILAPNGYLHAGTVVTLADTACGIGARLSLPPGAAGFTTVEVKCNFLHTSREGYITAVAKLIHGGRRTQVWDATVTDEQGRVMALFRCTQILLTGEPQDPGAKA